MINFNVAAFRITITANENGMVEIFRTRSYILVGVKKNNEQVTITLSVYKLTESGCRLSRLADYNDLLKENKLS